MRKCHRVPPAGSVTPLAGIHHVSVRTPDVDRWLSFHTEILGAPVLFDGAYGGGRAVAVATSGEAALEARSGQSVLVLDHIALAASGRAAFLDLRRALLRAGVTDGVVHDCGRFLNVHYRDPDGCRAELVWTIRPGVPLEYPRPVDERQLATF